MTLFGSLFGTGGLTKVGSGTLLLAATNTYSGNTLIDGGTLALGSPLALQQSTLDTSGSGSLSFGTLTSATFGGLTGPGSVKLANSSAAAVDERREQWREHDLCGHPAGFRQPEQDRQWLADSDRQQHLFRHDDGP